jgi:uncharacterized Zn finger protein
MPKQTKPPGESWWTRRWLANLESFGWEYQSRLARGRSYARGGHVLQAEVRAGGVTAQVWGSAPRPYHVQIRLQPLSGAAWDSTIAALAERAAYVAKLLAGEMPQDIEQIFAAAGAHLFPESPGVIESSCTCPDWANPCKHVAAVHYVLASNLDAQPFLLFQLRGRTAEQITAALRGRWADEASSAGESAAQEPGQESAPEVAPEALTAPLRSERFFQAGPELDALSLAIRPPQVEAALLKRLGRPPFAGKNEDPLPALTQVYAAVTKRALQALGRSGEQRRKGGG